MLLHTLNYLRMDGIIMKISKRSLSVMVFSLYFSWLLAFPFQGQVLYAISGYYNIDATSLIFEATIAHFIGLFACGFFIKSIRSANNLMTFSMIICIAGTAVFFFSPSILWNISIIILALLSGACVAAWGYYFKVYTPANERIKTAADIIVYSNVLMIVINTIAIIVSPQWGISISILMIIMALLIKRKLPIDTEQSAEKGSEAAQNPISLNKPLALLYLFIVVITINSGLMYSVVNPAFAHIEWLVSWYWAIPYIIAIFIVSNLPNKVNRNYLLFMAITMIGISFVFFMILDRSALSYIIIDTLMLGAFGVYDLFWWCILGELLDFHANPATILGTGLSANVLGILAGGAIGSFIFGPYAGSNSSILAIVVVLITLMILPLLFRYLSLLLKNHVFLTAIYEMPPEKQKETIESLTRIDLLTERESEIAALLLTGKTYKAIAAELFISENTIKTHVKNIYSKYNVQSKVELIRLLMQKEDYKA